MKIRNKNDGWEDKRQFEALRVARKAAEVSGRAYLPWWQKWDYNGVEIIRREENIREEKKEMREKREKRWLKKKRW